ncbi:helix-turn-helix domain-containing protein [Sulfurimonas sp.]|uniref:helix-turn-helix domain-containing protein n=1 Tax=Sulfurimonas sp. TaxID=2022749 RepID=UPI00286E3E4F|nr:helix-turn-helix domain-containing protein [Sulfurimonas sp.]
MSKFLSIEILTKMSIEAQNQQLRLFSKVDITTKLKILEQQKQFFHKLKNSYADIDNAVMTLASLILAIHFIVGKLDDVNLNAIKLRGKNNKVKVKRQKILGYWAIVRTLKLEQNFSFRKIAQYLKKYHKLEVSYSTIYELWNELENNAKNEEN